MMAWRRGIGGGLAGTGIDLVATTIAFERIGEQAAHTRIASDRAVVIFIGWLGIHHAILVVTC